MSGWRAYISGSGVNCGWRQFAAVSNFLFLYNFTYMYTYTYATTRSRTSTYEILRAVKFWCRAVCVSTTKKIPTPEGVGTYLCGWRCHPIHSAGLYPALTQPAMV